MLNAIMYLSADLLRKLGEKGASTALHKSEGLVLNMLSHKLSGFKSLALLVVGDWWPCLVSAINHSQNDCMCDVSRKTWQTARAGRKIYFHSSSPYVQVSNDSQLDIGLICSYSA